MGPFEIFQRPICQKTLTVPKKLKGGPFSLARYCMLRGKNRNTFLVQLLKMVQFDTMKFRRTL